MIDFHFMIFHENLSFQDNLENMVYNNVETSAPSLNLILLPEV